MAKNPTETTQQEIATEEVVLRDESDEIIDDLKSQLATLKGQLAAFNSAQSEQSADTDPEHAQLTKAWNDGLAPHLASRLQLPAQELTGRLERLIDQVEDPGLRHELERCRDIAYFLFDTFRKISTSHQLLTESLTAPKIEVELADFCRLLEHILPTRGTPLLVTRNTKLPKRIIFASQSASAVMKAMAELAEILFGKDLAVDVSELKGGERPSLVFRISSDTASEAASEGDEVAAFAMRQGITPNTVVDLLYVEKIIELQGGDFSFHRREGRVYGFEIRLPYGPIEEERPQP